MKKTLAILLCLVMVIALAACGGGGGGSTDGGGSGGDGGSDLSGEPVKIGVIVPLSGTTAYDGEKARYGVEAAQKYINDNGGVLGGRPIEIVVEDSATDPDTSASAAEKLINSDGVVALLGAFNSSCTAAVMPIAKDNQIPLITSIATSATLTEEGNEWFFRSVGISKLYIDSFAEKVINEIGGKNIAYIHENGDWGLGSVNAFKACAEGLGAKTLTVQVVNATDADLYTQLTAIKDTNPDAIYAVSNLANAVRIATQAREIGITCPIIGEGSWATSDFIEQCGDAAEGIYGMVEYLPDIDTPMNPTFLEYYKAVSNGASIDKYGACGFNSCYVMAKAIDAAGSTDATAIRDALKATDLEIVQGNLKFNEKGQGYGFETFLSKNVNGVATCAGSAIVEIKD